MASETLEKRVQNLEETVTRLFDLPKRVTALEGQVLQLRQDMRGEFSAVGWSSARSFRALKHACAMRFTRQQRRCTQTFAGK